jgi:hypothetical protein
VQEGGDVKIKATEEPPVRLPVLVRAHDAGATHAHVTWFKPLEGTKRLLATLTPRGGPGIIPSTAEQRLLNLVTTHACLVNPL